MTLPAKELRKQWDGLGPKKCMDLLTQNVLEGQISMKDFSIRDLAQSLIPDGVEFVRQMGPNEGLRVFEAADVVDTSAFSNITGQLLFSTIMEALSLENLVGDRLMTTFQSQFKDEEKIPGISTATDEFVKEVPEADPFPLVGISEEWILAPRTEKHGGIIGLTREMVTADRTGLLIQRARDVGMKLAIRREKEQLKTALGLKDNDYNRNGVVRDAYNAGAAGFNNMDGTIMVDVSDIQAVEEVLRQIHDPNNGEPLNVSPKLIVCSDNLAWLARRIIRTVQLRAGNITAAPGLQTQEVGSTIPFDLDIVHNEYITQLILDAGTAGGEITSGSGGIVCAARANALVFWYMGDFKRAFAWKEVYPLQVEEEPMGASVQFERDILMRFKVSYSGIGVVMEPRVVNRSVGG